MKNDEHRDAPTAHLYKSQIVNRKSQIANRGRMQHVPTLFPWPLTKLKE